VSSFLSRSVMWDLSIGYPVTGPFILSVGNWMYWVYLLGGLTVPYVNLVGFFTWWVWFLFLGKKLSTRLLWLFIYLCSSQIWMYIFIWCMIQNRCIISNASIQLRYELLFPVGVRPCSGVCNWYSWYWYMWAVICPSVRTTPLLDVCPLPYLVGSAGSLRSPPHPSIKSTLRASIILSPWIALPAKAQPHHLSGTGVTLITYGGEMGTIRNPSHSVKR
jgi:hypothetical protein